MMGRTHLAVGIATAMLITQPSSWIQFSEAIIGGAVGGILSDVDLNPAAPKKTKKKKKKNDSGSSNTYPQAIALLLTCILLAVDYFSRGGICIAIAENRRLATIGAIAWLLLVLLGKVCRHRGFTHSLLALPLYSFSVYLIYKPIGIAFAIGFASHILIDLFNKTSVQIFFPLQRGFCFYLCHADGVINDVLFGLSVALTFFLPFAHYFL